jgi:membrane protein DedA with SNARE-associated domain
MSDIDSIIATYGLLAVFLGVIIEGETVVFIAGLLAHRGDIGILPLCIVAFLGTMTADNLFFYTGALAGKAFLRKLPFLDTRVTKIKKIFEKHPFSIVMVFRFMYGFRIATPCVVGMSKYNKLKFLTMDSISSFTWSITYAVAGYMFGHLIDKLLHDARRYELWIALGIGIIGVCVAYWQIRRLVIKHREKKAIAGSLEQFEDELEKLEKDEEI